MPRPRAIVYGRAMPTQPLTLTLANGETGGEVSGLLLMPEEPTAILVFGHGAGAGMRHPFMAHTARDLAARGIATLRYQFPYMEKGGKRPDPPAVAHAAVRAAAAEGLRRAGDLPLFAGGRSFGARMTSQAQAKAALEGVRGLVFFAFPLHPAGKPGTDRADHLEAVTVPMLFLQGTNDALAGLDLLRPVVEGLGVRGALVLADDADHSFHVPARTGRKDADVLNDLLARTVAWMRAA